VHSGISVLNCNTIAAWTPTSAAHLCVVFVTSLFVAVATRTYRRSTTKIYGSAPIAETKLYNLISQVQSFNIDGQVVNLLVVSPFPFCRRKCHILLVRNVGQKSSLTVGGRMNQLLDSRLQCTLCVFVSCQGKYCSILSPQAERFLYLIDISLTFALPLHSFSIPATQRRAAICCKCHRRKLRRERIGSSVSTRPYNRENCVSELSKSITLLIPSSSQDSWARPCMMQQRFASSTQTIRFGMELTP